MGMEEMCIVPGWVCSRPFISRKPLVVPRSCAFASPLQRRDMVILTEFMTGQPPEWRRARPS